MFVHWPMAASLSYLPSRLEMAFSIAMAMYTAAEEIVSNNLIPRSRWVYRKPADLAV